MSITSISSSTFISDTIIYIRNKLNDNIIDPLSSSRPVKERFVRTSYPKMPVNYPIITITDSGTSQLARLGMMSEGTILRIPLEIRIWARNVKERDEVFDEVYTYLRTNQLSGDDITGANLHDFAMGSVVNVPGEKEQSKVMEVSYLFIAE